MKSRTLAPRPSRCAAIVINAPTVTTPVPPTPATRISKGSALASRRGAGSAAALASTSAATTFAPTPRLSLPPSTETKEGQKPLTQE